MALVDTLYGAPSLTCTQGRLLVQAALHCADSVPADGTTSLLQRKIITSMPVRNVLAMMERALEHRMAAAEDVTLLERIQHAIILLAEHHEDAQLQRLSLAFGRIEAFLVTLT